MYPRKEPRQMGMTFLIVRFLIGIHPNFINDRSANELHVILPLMKDIIIDVGVFVRKRSCTKLCPYFT
jgi:hypothetical protein